MIQDNSTAPNPLISPLAEPLARQHLDFLDGIRALAALYVMLGHTYLLVFLDRPVATQLGIRWMLYGHFAVDVFIVLSGFCLALPVAQKGALRGGAKEFFLRRARRILPPFYGALMLALALFFFPRTSPFYPDALHVRHLDPFLIKSILVNVVLLNDFNTWATWIDPPFWSVAVEWKIYFLFPLLVWLWLRQGWKVMLLAAAIIGYGLTGLVHLLFPHFMIFPTCLWYIFLFALGICAAHAAFGKENSVKAGADPDRRWLWVAGASLALCIGLLIALPIDLGTKVTTDMHVKAYANHLPFIDAGVGLLFASCLVLLGRSSRQARPGPGVRALSWKPLAFLGTFAYSIYLVHWPLIDVAQAILFHA
ncbi:MAG: acyltransferase, partial [Armatimonadota bacterium]|nr:acyltransferase [Armatimonadota bacterium]